MWLNFLLFKRLNNILPLVYSTLSFFIYWLFPYLSYYKWCCNEHGSADISFWDLDFSLFLFLYMSLCFSVSLSLSLSLCLCLSLSLSLSIYIYIYMSLDHVAILFLTLNFLEELPNRFPQQLPHFVFPLNSMYCTGVSVSPHPC
jgi:hypothetical protein